MENIIRKTVDEVQKLLNINTEWEQRFAEYLTDIDRQMAENNRCRKLFQVKAPLYVYSSISKAKSSKCEYDIRFNGQSVAALKIETDDKITVVPRDSVSKYFVINTESSFDWHSIHARTFRKHFYLLPDNTKTKSPEHALENRLLAEFSKSGSIGKKIVGIQPVKLNGMFFQMPTPLSASTSTIKYAGVSGGGIDILSRIKVAGKKINESSELVVFEVKDENVKSEPVEKVIIQAVAYGVFIANLLSKNISWLEKFGLNGNSKTINVATLMPKGETEGSFEWLKFPVGNYEVELHTLYFDTNFDFSGSLMNKIRVNK